MSKLADQYPHIAEFFAKHAQHWPTMNQDASICEALNELDDKGHYELPSWLSASGNPEILDLESKDG